MRFASGMRLVDIEEDRREPYQPMKWFDTCTGHLKVRDESSGKWIVVEDKDMDEQTRAEVEELRRRVKRVGLWE